MNIVCKISFSIVLMSVLNLSPVQGQNFNYKYYSSTKIENSETYRQGNMYQKDLLLFMDIVQSCHPAFAPGQDFPFNVDSIKQQGYQWASQCRSVNSLKYYLQSIVTLLNDGHTALSPDINMNFIYPFIFFTDNLNIYLRGINQTENTSLGKQIVQINGNPIWEVINSFKSSISSDNEVYFLDKVNNMMQSYSMWENNPYCLPDSTLLLTFMDASSLSLRPVSQKEMNMVIQQAKNQPNTVMKNTRQPFLYKLLPEKNTCYLQFNTCMDQSALRYQYAMNRPANLSDDDLEKMLSQYPRFDTFLQEMFQAIATNNIQTLVVDVRNNGGGNSKLCDVLLSWLKPFNEIQSGTSSIRFSELWEQQYPALAVDYKQALAKTRQPFEMGKLYDTSFLSDLFDNQNDSSVLQKANEYFRQNEDENKVFKGNVIFIQGDKTFSSAGMLLLKARDNGIGKIIGNKSSYRTCNYGDLLAYELPNTHLKGFVSHKIFNRPDINKCNEISLIPDVYLPITWADVLEGKDVYWEWILNYYGK